LALKAFGNRLVGHDSSPLIELPFNLILAQNTEQQSLKRQLRACSRSARRVPGKSHAGNS
jgi:hypothetical protein